MKFLVVGGGYAAMSAIGWIDRLFPDSTVRVVTSRALGASMAFDAGEEGLLANTDYSTFTVGGEPLMDAPPRGDCLFPARSSVGRRLGALARWYERKPELDVCCDPGRGDGETRWVDECVEKCGVDVVIDCRGPRPGGLGRDVHDSPIADMVRKGDPIMVRGMGPSAVDAVFRIVGRGGICDVSSRSGLFTAVRSRTPRNQSLVPRLRQAADGVDAPVGGDAWLEGVLRKLGVRPPAPHDEGMRGVKLLERDCADCRGAGGSEWQEYVCPIVDLVNHMAAGRNVCFGKGFWRFSGAMPDVVAERLLELFRQGLIKIVDDDSEVQKMGISPSAVVDATGLRRRPALRAKVPVVRAGVNNLEWPINNAAFLTDDHIGAALASMRMREGSL